MKPTATRAASVGDSSERLGQLLSRCSLGDQAAFSELYEATSAKLFGISLRILRREAWAEEALQEAYVKMWRHAGSYNPGRGRPMTWMINVVRNQSLDLLRRADYRVAEDEWSAEKDQRTSADNPAAQAETSEEMQQVLGCLGNLGEEQRDCILLSYHQGLTPTEVAHRLKRPVGTVKTWIRRGLIKLRECLEKKGVGQ
ncbi:sigma-70 family RNA polymerase sigma factor [Pelagibius marinus]|uniref:sigma-70 family RNA polymerase sigma factor n=1 Tax=Pelagibius marinus TaxID=2762760 RepID=UPI0018730A23|nr:sigma-70 family RNA polymerase sigma factor [Pelagibius marinus]